MLDGSPRSPASCLTIQKNELNNCATFAVWATLNQLGAKFLQLLQANCSSQTVVFNHSNLMSAGVWRYTEG